MIFKWGSSSLSFKTVFFFDFQIEVNFVLSDFVKTFLLPQLFIDADRRLIPIKMPVCIVNYISQLAIANLLKESKFVRYKNVSLSRAVHLSAVLVFTIIYRSSNNERHQNSMYQLLQSHKINIFRCCCSFAF